MEGATSINYNCKKRNKQRKGSLSHGFESFRDFLLLLRGIFFRWDTSIRGSSPPFSLKPCTQPKRAPHPGRYEAGPRLRNQIRGTIHRIFWNGHLQGETRGKARTGSTGKTRGEGCVSEAEDPSPPYGICPLPTTKHPTRRARAFGKDPPPRARDFSIRAFSSC